MINGRSVVAFVPARGGSKGIKNKNIINLEGKPLISYTIEAAKKSSYIDSIIVSTDSKLIAKTVEKMGVAVPFLRPKRLASDHSKTIDAVLHMIKWLDNSGEKFDILILLQPTQPLRTVSDIDGAIEKFELMDERALASVCEVDDNPILIRTINGKGELDRIIDTQSTVRRQDMPLFYKVNGAVYINNMSDINQNTSFNDNRVPFLMEKTHSIDIDDDDDLEMAKILLRRRKK